MDENEYVEVVLLSTNLQTVLMSRNDGEWHLPHFKYPCSERYGPSVQLLCQDFKDLVGVEDDHVFFTARMDMLAPFLTEDVKRTAGVKSTVTLFLLEMHGDSSPEKLVLPEDMDWKYMQFISSLLSEPQDLIGKSVLERVQDCLAVPGTYLLSLSDPRFRSG